MKENTPRDKVVAQSCTLPYRRIGFCVRSMHHTPCEFGRNADSRRRNRFDALPMQLKRPSLYKILSRRGNPTLATLQEILEPLGLRVSVTLDKAA